MVKRAKPTPMNDVLVHNQMDWKWPKKPTLPAPEPSASIIDENEEWDKNIYPEHQSHYNLCRKDIEDNRGQANGNIRMSPDRLDSPNSPGSSGRKSGRLRVIALQASSEADAYDPTNLASSRRGSQHAHDDSYSLKRDESLNEADISASFNKPPTFPRSPGLKFPRNGREGPRSPDCSPPDYIRSSENYIFEYDSSDRNDHPTDGPIFSHEVAANKGSYLFSIPIPPSPPTSSPVVLRNGHSGSRDNGGADSDFGGTNNSHSLQKHGEDSTSNRAYRSNQTNESLRYDSLNTSELSAITALQRGGDLEVSVSSDESEHNFDKKQSDNDQGFHEVEHVNNDDGSSEYMNNSRADIFIAPELLDEKLSTSNNVVDEFDPYDIEHVGPISVDDFINNAYEAEVFRRNNGAILSPIKQTASPRQHKTSSYISSSGGSQNSTAIHTRSPLIDRGKVCKNSPQPVSDLLNTQMNTPIVESGDDLTSELSSRVMSRLSSYSGSLDTTEVPEESKSQYSGYLFREPALDKYSKNLAVEGKRQSRSTTGITDFSQFGKSEVVRTLHEILNRWTEQRSEWAKEEEQYSERIMENRIHSLKYGGDNAPSAEEALLLRRLNDEVNIS